MAEFSYRTRETNIKRFREETFDLLVIGGGITGAAVARDAASRGLNVALVEKNDFAHGTSSKSSKLIHGGLRYLENLEFKLVFEALSERSHLMKTMPHMVRPLPFYFPVFKGDRNSKTKIGLGMWFYDLLALFRTPRFHKNLSRDGFLKEIPFVKGDGLVGGYRYFDASMWDDVMVIEVLRSAQVLGAACANYVEALNPIWKGEQIIGFRVRDRESNQNRPEFELKAKRTVICVGPYTDQLGLKLNAQWKRWIKPSKGVHLVFDWKKIPLPGTLVMSHPTDGRISFAIPRPDLGAGVVIVGTTDGPTPIDPDDAKVEEADTQYLLTMLQNYFPSLNIGHEDIISSYVGVRPLMDPNYGKGAGIAGQSLQKVSREHHIEKITGGVVAVAGGKYTTHRTMAVEIVDEVISAWRSDARHGKCDPMPGRIEASHTRAAVNPKALTKERLAQEIIAKEKAISIPETIWDRYGAEAMDVHAIAYRNAGRDLGGPDQDPEGFPWLDAQLRFAIRNGMVLHLDDFYHRRSPLYLSRKDHGYPWAKRLAKILSDEREPGTVDQAKELKRLGLE